MNLPNFQDSRIIDVNFGDNCSVVQPVNLYGCTIGNECFIGPFVEIQKDVVIGDRCRIQSHSFLCELVTIGNDCFIAHGVMFVNDLFKLGFAAREQPEYLEATDLGEDVCIGSNTTVLPVSICSNVIIGAGSVVTKDITEPGVYAGNPAVKV